MPILNEKSIYELKWQYNYNLNRYYNGCNYISEHLKEADKYEPELINIIENIDLLLEEITKYKKVTKEEILNGFEIE